jgi:hypothetical protein
VYCDTDKESNHSLGKESVLCLFTVNPDATVCHTPRRLNVLIEGFSFLNWFLQVNNEITCRSRAHCTKWPFIFTSRKCPLKCYGKSLTEKKIYVCVEAVPQLVPSTGV